VTPFLPLADGAQVELTFLQGGKFFHNRLWFVDRDPPITSAHLQALADGVFAWHAANIMPALASSLSLELVAAIEWVSGGGLAEISTASAVPGGSSSPSYSAKVAIKLNLRWPANIRLKQNANYVMGIPDDMVDTNVYSSTIRDALFDGYAALIDLAPTFGTFPGWRWVVASSWEDNALRSELFARACQGPIFKSPYVGQRRRRLT